MKMIMPPSLLPKITERRERTHETSHLRRPAAGHTEPSLSYQHLRCGTHSAPFLRSGHTGGLPLSPGYHSDLIMGALSSEAMALALPILAALPYTASFIDDVKSGFIKEYLPRITEPFYMVDKSRSKKQGGAGLGLAIVQRIASAHGAALTAESIPGEFTLIKIVFPTK